MSKDRTTTNAVLVLCREKDRCEPWAHIFLKAGAESVYVKKGGGEALEISSSSNLAGVLKTWGDIPDEVLAVLVHAGDSDLWNGGNEAQQVFWFNAPGEPSAKGDDLPVKRRTSAVDFDVTVSDAEEILAYSAGEREEIPSCCEQRKGAEVLPAISILCQGYLAVHAEKHGDEKQVSKALDHMGWSDDLMTNSSNGRAKNVGDAKWWKVFSDENGLIDKAKKEWGDKEGWSKVEDLLEEITDEETGGIADRPRALEGKNARRIVAEAYVKLAERLGGEKS